ncbi:MAG TPA: glycosyltransferase [Candidatus Limnocylindria bacterium]|nr:glycosyltransferase [Candidatus Limnocylindria bacterium]
MRLALIRLVAVAALLVTVAYLAWRGTSTLNLDAWYLSVPLLVLEIHAAVGLGLFAYSLWDVDRHPGRGRLDPEPRIAVLIPTFNEGPEILIPTISAAVALEPAHETWVLDDGGRVEIRELAEALGANYVARTDRRHAKAGNVNNALSMIDADIIGVLDADHVPLPGFLKNTLGYFADPRVAVVQTPQEFYNVTSFEHGAGEAYGEPFHEQTLFYRLLEPGKNRWDAAFWCGTNALVRVSALREVGGVATETVTEDIHTTIRLHRRGWKSVYHNEVLARGLAADDAAQYQLQRNRWGTGAMQVLRTENPLFVRGLTIRQRLAYAATLLGWFDSWRTLGLLLLPPAVLLTGQIPILADGRVFVTFFAATYALQQGAMYLLGRGAYRPILSVVFELVRMTPNLVATTTLFVPRAPKFRVTPKGRMASRRWRVEPPKPLRLILGLSVIGAAVYLFSAAGLFPMEYEEEWAARGALLWLVFNALLVWLAIGRVRSLRYAAERRAAVRFAVDRPATLDGEPCVAHDLSVGGALLATRRRLHGDRHMVSVDLGSGEIPLWAVVRSSRQGPEGAIFYAMEWEPGQYPARGELARELFTGRYPVVGTVKTPWGELLRSELGSLVGRLGRVGLPRRRPAGLPG